MQAEKQVDRFRVGLIGYGIGKLYAIAFRSANLMYADLPQVELVGIATSSKQSAAAAVRQFGFERSTQRYQDLLESEDIQAVIIATPNAEHFPMLKEALKTDKAIYIDKPLTHNLKEAKEIWSIARAAGRDAQLVFQFRYCPAVSHAAQLIHSGELGTIHSFRWWHLRSSYVNPDKPLRWKGSFQASGGGVVADLLPHSFDLLIWMLGMPERVAASGRTFVKERPASADSRERVAIDTEDHAIALLELPGGAIGSVETGRLVVGAVNEMGFEVFGSQGSLRWEAMNPNYLQYAGPGLEAAKGGWAFLPTMHKLANGCLLPDDLSIGMMQFYIASAADFIRRTNTNQPYETGIAQGVNVQSLIEAVIHSYKNQGIWTAVDKE